MMDNEEKYVALIKKIANVMDECDLVSVHVSENSGANHMSFSLQKSGALFTPHINNNEILSSSSIDAKSDSESESFTPSAAGAEDIKSPMVGVYYSSPSPEADPFVRIGDMVKKGDVLCILEAMKLMNEITAEQDGKIADICAKNGDVVEFGQVLFKVV